MPRQVSESARVNKLLKKWLVALELSPPVWNKVSVDFYDPSEEEDSEGSCGWQREYGEAWIYISSAIRGNWNDIEETIVHELIHLKLEGHKDLVSMAPDKYDPVYENGLNVISRELVKTSGRRKAK